MKTSRRILLTVAAFALSVATFAQKTPYPVLGAQVFVEPGQTDEYIESLFQTLEDSGMEVARIRLFGVHVCRKDGSFDFSLYDKAFDAAARHGIKMFVTLFPPTDELTDVGGFKYPRSKRHLEEVDAYTEAVVNHFKSHPAMYCWVLQNEPGGGNSSPGTSDLAREKYEEFCAGRETVDNLEREGYLRADFRKEEFSRWYNVWFLRHIAQIVKDCDPVHGRHINPHQVLGLLHEYDFPELEEFLTSMGASMHLSWHFGLFQREEYPMGVSLMSQIVLSGAGANPAWITEMQGGPVTMSGNVVLCPTPAEMTQNIWTGITAGMQGIIFWTLNPRKAVMEAGEWSLVDMTGQPSERLEAASQVARLVKSEKDFFAGAEPEKSGIAILYNKESFWVQGRYAAVAKDKVRGRMASAVSESMVAAYSALCSWGVTPEVNDIDLVDLSSLKCVILPNMVCLTDAQTAALSAWVKGGGKLLLTGFTGYYDETMGCRFMDSSQLDELTGARLSEYAVRDEYFEMPLWDRKKISNHFWMGKVYPDSASPLLECEGNVVATEHSFGEGSVTWFPSLVELGSRVKGEDGLCELYHRFCGSDIEACRVHLRKPCKGILIQSLRSGDRHLTMIVNKSGKRQRLKVAGIPAGAEVLQGSAKVSRGRVRADSDSCTILKY